MIQIPFLFKDNKLFEIDNLRIKKIQEIKIFFYTYSFSRILRPELGNSLYKTLGEISSNENLQDVTSDILDHLNENINDVIFENVSIEKIENKHKITVSFQVKNNIISYDKEKIQIFI